LNKLLINLGILFAFIGSLYGALQIFDSRYANANDVQQIQQSLQQLQQSIVYDHLVSERKSKQDRVWSLSDRFEDTKHAPQAVKEELRRLQQDIIDLNDKIHGIELKVK
jgi:conjugal transfer/entry exclusion protein